MKLFLASFVLVASASLAHADLLPPEPAVTIHGKAADQIAKMVNREGSVKVSCAKNAHDEHYTCVMTKSE